jgi:protein-disulfide isomerase
MTPLARLLGGLLCGLLLACNPGENSPGKSATPGADLVVAEIGGSSVSQAELDTWLKEDLWSQQTEGKNASDLFELHFEGLERMIDERLLEQEAARSGTSVEELLEAEAKAHEQVSDEALSDFFAENRARLPSETFEELAPRIRQYLAQAQRATAIQDYAAALRERAGVSVKLEPPRVDVAATGPSLGPEDAPVTIIEFSDYECPFCQRAHPTVNRVLERYGDRVRLVYRHFPLRFHERARPAAEAAACANAQGRFWDYHERLFSEGGELADADLERIAAGSELDMTAFTTCFAGRQFQDTVEADIKAGSEAGVDGPPAFFVNGIRLTGAQPLEAFAKLIDRELARVQSE